MSLLDELFEEHRVLARESRLVVWAVQHLSEKEARPALSRFRQMVLRHVEREHNELVPQLAACGPEGRKLAERFNAALETVTQQILEFLNNYEATAAPNRALIIRDLAQVTKALTRRIELEERRFFPLCRVYLALPVRDDGKPR